MVQFLNANKTKFLGVAMALVSYFQLPANVETMSKLLSPSAMAMIGMGLGACAVVFGFLNNPKPAE